MAKQTQKAPVISNLFSEVNDTIGSIYDASQKIKYEADSCDFFRRIRE